VEAPTRPPVANSAIPAATIASRRSSAVIRVGRVMACVMAPNLVLTKKAVKRA
jgi:hypothetical protein